MTARADDPLRAVEEAERRGLERLGRKALALERLLEISRDLATLDPEEALRRILDRVLELTGTRRGAVLLAGEGGDLRVALAREVGEGELGPESVALSRSVALRAMATGEPVVVADAPASEHGGRTSVVELGLVALVAVPLVARGKTLGVIYLDTDRTRHGVGQLDPAMLEAFAAQAAVALDNARLHRRLEEDYVRLRRSVEESFRFEGMVYRSAAMHRVCGAVRQVAASDVTVLVTGETGTGKELVARAIHELSERRRGPFLAQNAGALPDPLLESELFGHRRGAFSGALEHKPGLFEAASAGTVFLDEIGEASPALQVRLLRLLESGALRRVGETAERKVDVRVVAATHRDLAAEVRAGRFRADLYYRLSVVPIRLPPLAERREDVEPLARWFVERANRELGRSVRTIPAATLAALAARDWPGNVRELANVVQRLVLLSPGEELASLEALEEAPPPAAPLAADTAGPVPTLAEVEREHVRRVLAMAGGNLSQAARLLGLHRGTLRWRLKKLGLDAGGP